MSYLPTLLGGRPDREAIPAGWGRHPLGARNQIVKQRGGRFIVQSTDPSIPLDRVPYFTKDLVRLTVVGVAMMVLLAVGSVTITQIVK